jgi:hypothetical protein
MSKPRLGAAASHHVDPAVEGRLLSVAFESLEEFCPRSPE